MRTIRAGRVLGIDVFVDPSLVLLLGLLAWSLYVRFGAAYPDTSTGTLRLLALGGGLLFLASVLLHELSHSVVARRRGFAVRRIRLFIFGGVSEIEEDATTPVEDFAVAFAGPAASIAAGALLLLGAWPFGGPVPAMLRLIGLMNLLLAVFNLLPGLPLDGGRVLHALVWKRSGDKARATRIAVNVGRGLGMALMALGVVLIVVRGDLAGIWLLAIGWFLYQAATSSQVRERLIERTGESTMRDVMRPLAESADGQLSVAAVLERHGWNGRIRSMPVTIDGRVRGVIGDRELGPLDDAGRATTTAAEVMTPIGPNDVVDVAVSVLEFLKQEASPARRVLVTADNRVVGIVTSEELAHLFH